MAEDETAKLIQAGTKVLRSTQRLKETMARRAKSLDDQKMRRNIG